MYAGRRIRAVQDPAGLEYVSERLVTADEPDAPSPTGTRPAHRAHGAARDPGASCSRSSRSPTSRPRWCCAAAPRSTGDPRPHRRPAARGRRAVQRARRRGRPRVRGPPRCAAPPSCATTCASRCASTSRSRARRSGWKGLINDPHLDGSGDVNAGLRMARGLLLDVLALGLPVGCEFLDPITPQYISDTVSWGAIGARTTESQIAPPARLRPVDAGRLQEPHRRQRRRSRSTRCAPPPCPHAFAGVDRGRASRRSCTRAATPTATSSCAAAAAAPNYGAEDVAEALAKLRAAGLPERVVIDASHDNSGKDHTRQPAVAADVAAQVAAGNARDRRRDAGVVPRRRPAGPRGRRAARATASRSPTPAWTGTRPSEVLEQLATAVQARRAGMRIAVLGVGLIGGSIGLAAHEHVADAEVVGFGRDPDRLRRAVELGAIDSAADSVAAAVEGAELCFACAPVGALEGLVREALDAAGADCVVTDVGSTKQQLLTAVRRPALRRRPPDRRRRDGRRGARPRRPVRGRGLVPDAAAALRGAALRAPAPLRRGAGRASGGGRRRRRTTGSSRCSATCRTCWPTCWSPRRRAAWSTRARRLRHVGPSFRDMTRVAGANTDIWADIYRANRDAIVRGDPRLPRRAGACRAAAPGRRRGHLERARPRRSALAARGRAGRTSPFTSCASPSRIAQVSSPRWHSSSARRA